MNLSNIVFANTNIEKELNAGIAHKDKNRDYVHIRVQQRNKKKCITTIQGLEIDLDLKKILRAIKKCYSTNGTIIKDEKIGDVMQLQGDQRKNCLDFFTTYGIYKKDEIKIHGF